MKRSALLPRLLFSAAFAALALAVVGGQQPAPATVFTAAQAQSGQPAEQRRPPAGAGESPGRTRSEPTMECAPSARAVGPTRSAGL